MEVVEVPGLDEGIREYVWTLRGQGIETYESCEGGKGHSYPEPTVRFFGGREAGFKAFAVARTFRLPIKDFSRIWTVSDGEPTGPYWQMTFRQQGVFDDQGLRL